MSDDQKVEQAPVLKEDDKSQLEQLAKDAEKKNLDTSADMNQIKTNIDDIKTSVDGLKKDMEDFEKTKNTLAKEIIDQKQKDLEAKKLDIEKKKKETLELITKIRKERVDLKLETLDKKIFDEQNALLSQYEKDLQTIQPENKGFREKIKDGAGRAREWAKENPRKTGGIAVGATLLVGWIGGRFKSKDEYEEDEDGNRVKKKKKKFWNHGIGKFLKYAAIGVAGFFGIKRLINQFGKSEEKKHEGDDTEVLGTLRDTKNAVESFEAIKEPQTKEALNKVGDGINVFYDNVYKFDDGTSPAELTNERLGAGDDKYAGVIPHILDNTFATINDISSEQGLFMAGAYGDAVEVSKKFAGLLSKGLTSGTTWLVNSTLGMLGFPKVIGQVTEADMATKIQTFLSGDNKLHEVHLVYRKIFKTMSYLNYVENAFLGQKIEKLLSGGAPLYKKSGESWDAYEYDKDPDKLKKLVKEINDDPDEFKIGDATVESMKLNDFRNKKIRDIAAMGITQDAILTYSPDVQENVDDLNKKRNEKLALLEKSPDKALDALTELAEGEMGDSFFKSLSKIIPITHLLELFGVGREDEVKQKIMEKGGFKELLDSYKKEFQNLKGKDKATIKATIDKYYAQLKEITVTTAGIYESQDENGNRILHCVIPARNIFTGYATGAVTGISMIVRGVGEIGDGKLGAGSRDVLKGTVLTSGSVGFWMLFFRRTRRLGINLMLRPYAVPTKLIRKAAKPYAKVGTAELFHPWLLQSVFRLYRTPEAITKGLLNGMSAKSAYKLFKMQSNVTAGLEAKFLKDVLKLEHELPTQKAEFMMMEDLLKNERFGVLDRMMTKEGWLVTGTKKLSMQASLDAMMPIYTKILKSGTPNVQATGYKLLERLPIKERGKVEKLLSHPDIIAELNKVKNINDIPAIAKLLAKSLSKTNDVNVAIDACKNIIKNGIISNVTTEVVEEVIEDAIKNKAAYKIYETRTKGLLPKEFEAGGKYEKYPDFKERYAKATTDAERELVDSDFAKKLLQEGDNLHELLDFTPDQEAVYKLVQKDIKEIETKIAGLSKKTGNTLTTKIAHEVRIKNMIAFERQLADFTVDEISAFKSLKSLDFKTYHIIELLKLKKTNAVIASVLQDANPDFAKIVKTLKQEKSAAGISDELIKSLEDVRMKPLMKSAEAVAAFFRNILKFVGRVLKI